MEKSPSSSDAKPAVEPRRSPSRHSLEAWQTLNSAQLVCLVVGTASGLVGFVYGGLLLAAVVFDPARPLPEHTIFGAFAFPLLGMVMAALAGACSRNKDCRRAAFGEATPALLVASVGLLFAMIASAVIG